jgi:hypothetical protein
MSTYYEFEVSLLDIAPRIWRSFLLKRDLTFQDLHEAIQDSGPWSDYHLFEFRGGRKRELRIATSDDVDRPRKGSLKCPAAQEVALASFFRVTGQTCIYTYDFGDGWDHLVELKEIAPLKVNFRRRLLDGARSFPLEDCGGIYGYQRCLASIGLADPSDFDPDDLASIHDWVGNWDPERFDIEAAKALFSRRPSFRRRARREQ